MGFHRRRCSRQARAEHQGQGRQTNRAGRTPHRSRKASRRE